MFGYHDLLAFSPVESVYQFNWDRKAQTSAFAAEAR